MSRHVRFGPKSAGITDRGMQSTSQTFIVGKRVNHMVTISYGVVGVHKTYVSVHVET